MIKKALVLLLTLSIICFVLISAVNKPGMSPVAGLKPLKEQSAGNFLLPQNVVIQGDGNVFKLVENSNLFTRPVLELAAGGQGQLAYFVDNPAGSALSAQFKLQFLSTQGNGRIKISALDNQGREYRTVGWVVTGNVPESSSAAKWIDVRFTSNYAGNWITASHQIDRLMAEYFPGDDFSEIVSYRLSTEVGQGQHAIIEDFSLNFDITKQVKVRPVQKNYTVNIGTEFPLNVEITNSSAKPLSDIKIGLIEPYGYGLVALEQHETAIPVLAPGETTTLSFKIRAQRPHSVNLSQPWPVKFAVNGMEAGASAAVEVVDTRPGKVFYVMTEDLEPIDSAGYPVKWGNANGWLEPREFEVQMIAKAEQLNRIADKYGAKWTHYIAWPAVKAAEWADSYSSSGQWRKFVRNMTRSVEQETLRGHEYGIHMHSDYDPYLPGNILSYNKDIDGLWANHLRHGWAHSLSAEGNFDYYASRTGLLYFYQRILDKLAEKSGQGQLLTARAGSFDFGSGNSSEAMSINVYKKVGLWGSSDADGNAGGITAGDFGSDIYLTGLDDINMPAKDIASTGIVEFRPTPKQFIGYDSQSAVVMNQKVDQGMKEYLTNGTVKAGIHAITGFTHAMFIMGAGDWESTTGGQFAAIDDHLNYVSANYVKSDMLKFASATELIKAYLDYYTPQLVGVYGSQKASDLWSTEYNIDILGQDIPIDGNHVHQVQIKYPLYLRDSAYRVSVLKNGNQVYDTWGLPTPFNDIVFRADDRNATYSLKVYHNLAVARVIRYITALKRSNGK